MAAVFFKLISERSATFTTTRSSADEVNNVIPSRLCLIRVGQQESKYLNCNFFN